jgi:hypothetical protein
MRVAAFVRSTALRAEASAIGGLARVLEVVPLPPTAGGRLDRFGLEGAERLCRVFEVYRQVAPDSRFTMDQLIRLALELTERRDFEIGHCRHCHGALLVDRMGDARRVCPACREDTGGRAAASRGAAAHEEHDPTLPSAPEAEASRQQPLF